MKTNVPNMEKVNPYFHKALRSIYEYGSTNPEIQKMVVFGKATDLKFTPDRDDELDVAIFLKNPTQEKVISIGTEIEKLCALLWGCMMDDEAYDESILLQRSVERGVTIYEK